MALQQVANTDIQTGQSYNFGTINSGASSLLLQTGGTTRLTIDASGNAGLGVIPNDWNSSIVKAIQLGAGSIASDTTSYNFDVASNAYLATNAWKYVTTNYASIFRQTNGQHQWYTATSGTSGNSISFTQVMTLDASGSLGIGTTTPTQSSGWQNLTLNSASGTGSIINLMKSGSRIARFYSDATDVHIGSFTNIPLIIDTNNSERMRITSDGNVGIGTSSPSVRLQSAVSRTSGTNTVAFAISDNVTGAQTAGYGNKLVWYSNGTATEASIGFEVGGDGTNNQSQLSFYTQGTAGGSTRRMVIDNVGNVGIGLSSVSYKFDVLGITNGANQRFTSGTDENYMLLGAAVNAGSNNNSENKWSFRWKGRGNGGTISTSYHHWALYDELNSTYRLFVGYEGSVGIGTTTPSAKFDVRGNMLLIDNTTSSIYIKNNSGDSNGLKLYSDVSGLSHVNAGYGTLVFETSSTERMRLDSSGNLLIGNSNDVSTGAKVFALRSSAGYLYHAYGNFTSGGSGGIYSGVGYLGLNTDGAYALTFATNTTERMRITASGGLSIGVTTDAGAGNIMMSGGSGTIFANSTTSSRSYIELYNNTTGDMSLAATYTSAAIKFLTGGTTTPTERMRIDNVGNVGIGTSSPGGRLHIQKADATTLVIESTLANTNAEIKFKTTTRTWRIGSNVADSTSGALEFYDETGASTRMRIDTSGRLLLGTATTSVPSFGASKITIDSGGVDGINLLAATAANSFNILKPYGYTNGNMLSFAVIASGGASSTTVGSISISGSTTTYSTSSDYRLKENVQPIQNALATVNLLNPVTYDWKSDGSAGLGFIAHELQSVVPQCVTGVKDAVDENGNPVYQGVDTSFLVATLTKAIQEQQQLITELSNRIAILESK